MKLGKRTVRLNPNVKKFVCMMAIITGWYCWPKESEYKRWEAQKAAEEISNDA